MRFAERFGFAGPRFPQSPHELFAEMRGDATVLDDIEELRPAGGTVQFKDTFPAYPDGKARLASIVDVGLPRYAPLDSAYPLALITPASPKMINSIFGEFNRPDPTLRINPSDAAARALSDGDEVIITSALGEIVARATIDTDLRAGVVAMAKGVWLRDLEGNRGVNTLMPDTLSDVAGGACFNDARVEVSKR